MDTISSPMRDMLLVLYMNVFSMISRQNWIASGAFSMLGWPPEPSSPGMSFLSPVLVFTIVSHSTVAPHPHTTAPWIICYLIALYLGQRTWSQKKSFVRLAWEGMWLTSFDNTQVYRSLHYFFRASFFWTERTRISARLRVRDMCWWPRKIASMRIHSGKSAVLRNVSGTWLHHFSTKSVRIA